MIRVGVDVGGTHTDLVLIDEATKAIFAYKVPSSRDPSEATVEALCELCRASGVTPSQIGHFLHGTTIATNIVLHTMARAPDSLPLRASATSCISHGTSGRRRSASSSICRGSRTPGRTSRQVDGA